jgi:FKBP-type peptidyl-prolyl cis-trans isomerase FkpA
MGGWEILSSFILKVTLKRIAPLKREEDEFMARWCWGVLSLLCVAMVGCEEPITVTAAPPGVESPRLIPPTEAGVAQAIGETGDRTSVETKSKPSVYQGPLALPGEIGEEKRTQSGVKYWTLKAGNGPEVKHGQKVTFHYTGWILDGPQFDSSRPRKKPVTRVVGFGEMIQGWEDAIPGMRVGEVRKMSVMPGLAYGSEGLVGSIPPNANLIFEVEVLSAEDVNADNAAPAPENATAKAPENAAAKAPEGAGNAVKTP